MSVKWIDYKGKPILYVDYRGLDEKQILENLELEAQAIMDAKTKVLVLDNFGSHPATPRFMERAKELGRAGMEANTAKNAGLGITGLKKVLLQAYNTFTGGKLQPFETEIEAMEWLVKP